MRNQQFAFFTLVSVNVSLSSAVFYIQIVEQNMNSEYPFYLKPVALRL